MVINKTSLVLPEGQYYKEESPKVQVYLHHTVGGSAKSSFDFWQTTPEKVGTAFLVERNGEVFQVFDPKYWAYHLGLKVAGNTKANRESIGIELCSEGALKSGEELNRALQSANMPVHFDDFYLYSFDIDTPPFKNAKKLYHRLNDVAEYYDHGSPWRGYQFFDRYDDAQITAACELVKFLCETYEIPKTLIAGADKTAFDLNLLNVKGVLSHCNVRLDKTDLNPSFPWPVLSSTLS